MELLTATEKLKKFFLTTRNVRYVHHGWHIEHLFLSDKNFFSFPVTVNNSIKVGPLVFLL
jgi:hypothetical protein